MCNVSYFLDSVLYIVDHTHTLCSILNKSNYPLRLVFTRDGVGVEKVIRVAECNEIQTNAVFKIKSQLLAFSCYIAFFVNVRFFPGCHFLGFACELLN